MLPLHRRMHEEVADAYKECFAHYGENATDREIFACVASSIAVDDPNRNYARSIFLVYAASMVFFMQVRANYECYDRGFHLLLAGEAVYDCEYSL
jgi:hypothetical protein